MSVTISAGIGSGRSFQSIDDNEMNVSNTNFKRLMTLLGYDDDIEWCGEFRGPALDELLAKIDFALNSITAMPALDGGTLTTSQQRPGKCRLIECGLPEGYFYQRLSTMECLVAHAISVNGAIVWGDVMPFIYWIYFDKCSEPERIYAKTMMEFMDILRRLIERTGEMPEWIQRTYK